MNLFSANEDVLQALFEASVLGILVVDQQGTMVMANPYCRRLFGYSEEELIGQPLEQLIPPRLKEEHAGLRESFFADPQARPMGTGRRLHGLRKDGEQFAVEVSLSHMEIKGQRYAIAFIADVTEHKQTEHLNTLLTRIFHESLNAIYVIDANTLRFVRANQGGLRSTGYTLTELRQRYAWDLKVGEDEASFRRRIAPLLTEAQPKVTFESVFVRRDGSSFPVEIHTQRFQYDTQPVLVQIVLDTTERQQAQAALQRAKDKLAMYLDVAASIFLVIERDHTVSLVNKCGCEVLGYPESEIIGKDWFTHFVPDAERERTWSVFDQLMREEMKEAAYFENHVMSRERGERLVEWRNTVIRNKKGTPVATLSSGIDITEKRKAEQAVTQALIEGQEAERRRIAQELHDGLGQSLTAIRLHLNALESDVSQFAQKNQEALEKVKLILQTTTQEVKSISRDLMPNVLKDYGLVKALEFLCQTINDAHTVQVQLQVYGLTHEPDQAHKIGLYRVVQELINNALKHAQATRIDVQLVEHEASVVLTVEDNGQGFDVPSPDSPRSSFGLRNIETRIKSLNGTFDIDSHPGTGTSVTVELPLT
ncbi:MAG: PAS domain S-box protein [Tunicatimonas sp.]